VNLIQLAEDGLHCSGFVKTAMKLWVPLMKKFVEVLSTSAS